jgi:hypothetical protein
VGSNLAAIGSGLSLFLFAAIFLAIEIVIIYYDRRLKPCAINAQGFAVHRIEH